MWGSSKEAAGRGLEWESCDSHCGVDTASDHLRSFMERRRGLGAGEGLNVQILSQGTRCAPSLALYLLKLLLLQWLQCVYGSYL